MTTPTMRLDRLLANMGYGSRREIAAMVAGECVTLDGVVLTDSGQHLTLTPDLPQRLQLEGAALDPLPGMVIMLHKPLGMTCSHKEAGALVYDVLPARFRQREPKISSIGRLDKDTTGLLLLTDDGALLHKVISPRQHVAKRYHVTLDRALQGDEVGVFAAGTLMLEREETPLLPVAMEVLGTHTARVTLHEGRYHQVRRMFAAIGNHVVALHRESIGGLSLPADLPAGQFRVLTPAEIAQIFAQ
ncbi:MAG: pseudouridine synthase [Rickettsiales bacterium]